MNRAATIGSMLSLWRRHTKACPHREKGRDWTKCTCPVWTDGDLRGERVRKSLDTRDWGRAGRKTAEMEDAAASGRIRKPVREATKAFLAQCSVEPSTMRKYKRIMRFIDEFAKKDAGIEHMDEVTIEVLDAYRDGRKLAALTWSKELQFLRQFFAFCAKRKWTTENPAKDMDMPSDPKPKERRPYTSEEITSIIAACDAFGKGAYERMRAKAMVLLMRFYGLRISDVATLKRDRVNGDQIFLHALKNGAPLWLPLYRDVAMALDRVPVPHGSTVEGGYFFWSGLGSVEEHVKTIGRTLQSVMRKAGVKDAHPHRFRHTLATDILISGGTIEDAANILGDTPETIAKHYAKWSREYQARTVEILARVHGTRTAHTKNESASPFNPIVNLVPGVGIERPSHSDSTQVADSTSGPKRPKAVKRGSRGTPTAQERHQ